ncbi:MAG: N-6 DNA methylase [Phycisphaerales bacterium]|nr:N-6 DNA methylase [Phycisphaerales bacterium]
MTDQTDLPATLRAIRATLNLTQEQLAERLGVSFATVNRWEGGNSKPQKAAQEAIAALAEEAGVEPEEAAASAPVPKRGRKKGASQSPTTKPMEQMLWDAACSIRGEKDAPKFKDYLLPLLFLKRLSDVFDDEVERLAEDYGDRETALQIADADHSLLRFYLPPEARWAVISGREAFDWPVKDKPRDIGEHLTKAMRAVVKHNPTLSGVIDVVDFAAERNGERDINPAKLRDVVETFSDPRYRLGLADVDPDFLGRAYEYLLRKFAEGSGQSAGEFFTPTNVGFLMAYILKPKPGQECHDYACGSAGLLIKLQLVARELDPTSKVPLKLTGQELQAESYAVARMNAIIHDMDVELQRGDTMINPKFRTADGRLRSFDLVVANPMWNQPFSTELYQNDPFDRFRDAGGITTGKGDWAWLQHTLKCLNNSGRAAVVLDAAAVTRGSGSTDDDKERNIRRWFVNNDLIEGVVLLPDNLFYNTTAAGIIVVLNKAKPKSRKGKIVLVNASHKFQKGRPKNYLPDEQISDIANAFNRAEPVDGEVAVITTEDAVDADYNLNPAKWARPASVSEIYDLEAIAEQVASLDARAVAIDETLRHTLLEAAKNKRDDVDGLPDGWTLEDFEQIASFASGRTPARANEAYWRDGKTPWVAISDMVPYGTVSETKEKISDSAFDEVFRGQAVEAGTLLMSYKLTIGRVAKLGMPACHNEAIISIYPRDDVDSTYLGYYLSQVDYADHQDRAVKGNTLNRDKISKIPVVLPPEGEQRKIASVLDLLREAIDIHAKKQELLEKAFSVLQSTLLSGAVRVSDLPSECIDRRIQESP